MTNKLLQRRRKAAPETGAAAVRGRRHRRRLHPHHRRRKRTHPGFHRHRDHEKGRGINETFTVRRIVNNEGVERIFPLHSPFISRVTVKRSGESRRAKLFYLRDRVGKATRLTEKRKGKKERCRPAAKPDWPRQGRNRD